MRVAIASRIFAPEPSAASFRLSALAEAYTRAGHSVEVLTVSPAKGSPPVAGEDKKFRVKRFPVLRDKHGYVRGYLQYLSFDIPLFFRILFGKSKDFIVVEPPPTTGFFVRVASALRRVPYGYYAADIWSDAVAGTSAAPSIVARVLRQVERFALRGARIVFSVSEGVTERLLEMGVPSASIVTVGNGVDLGAFPADGKAQVLDAPYFLYAGTASEVHGASIFVDAFRIFLERHPGAKLVFLGQGSERDSIEALSAQLLPSGSLVSLPREPPSVVASWLRGAITSLASSKPGQGYDFSFPTKMYASVAVGTPVIFTGRGPAIEFLHSTGSGWAVEYDALQVADAMTEAYEASLLPGWEAERLPFAQRMRGIVGLDRVAQRAVDATDKRLSSASGRRTSE